ncbi:MAG: hypothetical protein ACYDIA_23500 [Candidatus Humimicrobiaceae bacterium]
MFINNNFISLIFLGNFNPSILSLEFLRDKNILNIDDKLLREEAAPIFKALEFKDIKIIIDLERLQITEENIHDFKNNRIIDIANSYISVLEYTPVTVAGINFNTNCKIENVNKILELNEDRVVLKYLKAISQRIDVSKELNLENEKYLNLNFQYKISEDKLMQINLSNTNNGTFVLNYNFEIRNLKEVKENRFFLKENFLNIYNQYNSIINKYFN